MPSTTFDETARVFTIPAQHTNKLRCIVRGQQTAPVPLCRVMQQVFSADYNSVLDVPATNISHLGSEHERATRLVLCANYDATQGPTSCAMGDRCKYVHADLRTVPAPSHRVHINYAYRSLTAVTYDRYPAGALLNVHAPAKNGDRVDTLDSGLALKTKALEANRRPLSHCAHYYFNRTCNLGPECQFVHAVFIDPNAKPFQRAPAPRSLRTPTATAARVRPNPLNPVCLNDTQAADAIWMPSRPSFGDASACDTPLTSRHETPTVSSRPSPQSSMVNTPDVCGSPGCLPHRLHQAAPPPPPLLPSVSLSTATALGQCSSVVWTRDDRLFRRHNPYGAVRTQPIQFS